MFSVIIPTKDSERPLVPTLAALVPGATAGIVREVIVADGGSRDETAGVADVAGCRFFTSSEPLGARLSAAAKDARGAWLMFLPPGAVPEPTWIDESIRFTESTDLLGSPRSAVFALRSGGFAALIRRLSGALPRPAQGLMLPKLLYDQVGGHRAAPRMPKRICCAGSADGASSHCGPSRCRHRQIVDLVNDLVDVVILRVAGGCRVACAVSRPGASRRRRAPLHPLLHAPDRPAARASPRHRFLDDRGAHPLGACTS